ncbi:MAG: folate-binding protein [Dongiaceae bacterium]
MTPGIAEPTYLLPEGRGVIAVSGPDAVPFLQGIVSNDVTRVAPDRAIYAAFLTPQGKFLHDFFIARIGETLCLDCEAARRADLLRRLSVYRLRSKVELADATADLAVATMFGPRAAAVLGLPAEPGRAVAVAGGVAYVDPRLDALGARAVLPPPRAAAAVAAAGFVAGNPADYERLRLSLGVPDGSRDLPVEKAILLENGFDELHGVDWRKGCYLGQELTARTKYRGVIRKRLVPVRIDGPLPESGTPIHLGDREAGEMRSGADGIGLALLRLECLDPAVGGEVLVAGDSRLTPVKPGWVAF